MKNKALLLFIVLFSLNAYTQNTRKVIYGKIMGDSIAIADVHIINKTTKKGTISNKYGEFALPVKVLDTILFSAIQFRHKELIISELDLNTLQIVINLDSKLNELEEVIVSKPISVAKALNLPNADKKPLTKLEGRLNYYSKAPTPVVILTTLLGQRGGLEDIYYIVSGKRKKDRKFKKLIADDKLKDFNQKIIQKIRLHFKDDFFINTLQIPEEEINYFIEYCQTKDIVNLYDKERFIEIIDILIEESKPFLISLKDE